MTPVFANLFEPENENPETQTPENENSQIVMPLDYNRHICNSVCNGECYMLCYDAPDGKCDHYYDCPNNCYC